MGKLKPVEELAKDVRPGDIIRVRASIPRVEVDVVGYVTPLQQNRIALDSNYPSRRLGIPLIDGHMQIEVPGYGKGRIIGYEILRRAKP